MINQERKVQLPNKFLIHVMLLLNEIENGINDADLSPQMKCSIKYLQGEIDAKIERESRRNTFTAYKTAATPEERELNRREYLQKIDMNPDWVSDTETIF